MSDSNPARLNPFIALLQRKTSLRYLLTGGFNTALTFAAYSGMVLVGVDYLVANALAWVLGIAVSFTLNSRFVFRKEYRHRRLASFVASNIFSFIVSCIVLYLLVSVLHFARLSLHSLLFRL